MKIANKILSSLSKILEIFHWMIFSVGVLVFIVCCCNTQYVALALNTYSIDLTYYGADVGSIYDMWGEIEIFSVYIFIIGGILTAVLMALIFHNISVILKTISRKDENASPFQQSIVTKVRSIGIFLISLPAVDLVLDIIMYFVSTNHPRVTIDITGFMIGLVCLCLTQIFSYGAKLEEEVDGLL